MDSQNSTSKTDLLNGMLLRAWKERWTDCQWGINIKTILTRGVSGDVYNLAHCIYRQAIVGTVPNKLLLSYLKHSLCCHLISHAAVLNNFIDGWDNLDKIRLYREQEEKEEKESHVIKALLEFLDSIMEGVTCRGKPEESMLSEAMITVVLYLMAFFNHKDVVEEISSVFEKIVNNQFLLGVIFIGKHEYPNKYKNIVRFTNEANTRIRQTNVTAMIRKIAQLEVSSFEMKEFDAKTVEPITYCIQPFLAIEILLNPSSETQIYVKELLMIQRLKGYSIPRLFCELIRACLVSLNDVSGTGTARESIICAFTFIKIPHILKQLHPNAKDCKHVVDAFELLFQDPTILDFSDTKCGCNTVEYLLNEMLKLSLINEKAAKNVAIKREAMIGDNLAKLELTNSQPYVKFVMRAEPPLAGILKTLSADYNKVQEALLHMLCQVLSGNSFELILSVAIIEGKLKTFVSRLIKCNESSKQVPGELGKPAMIRSALFDVSFLMLSFIVQTYGSDVVLDENGDTFFEKFVRDFMVERNKSKSPMNMVRLCDQSKVDELLIHLNSPEGLKGSSLKWHEICTNIPGMLYQVLLAWENETLSTGEIKKFLDNMKLSLCSYSVSAASWLCAYMQIVRQDMLLKPMNMVQQFLTTLTPEEMMQQENLKERLGLTYLIIRKMQHDFHPAGNPKMRAIMQPQNLVSQNPLEEQFNDVWKSITDRGWLPIDSAQTLESLLQSCGPFWLVDKMVKQILKCKYIREMTKTMDIVFSIMHLDIERCTVALLSQLIPMMLLNKLQNSEIVDPYSRVLAKLCVYAIMSTMECPNTPSKKRTRNIEADEIDNLCPSAKMRKTENSPCDSNSSDNADQIINRELPTNLREPLQSCLQTLFKTFSQYIVTDELSPKIFFIFQFISLLVQIGKDRIKPVLKLIPNGLIQNLLKINSDDMSVGFILRLYDLNVPAGRQLAMSDLCLLRNIQLRKESIKL